MRSKRLDYWFPFYLRLGESLRSHRDCAARPLAAPVIYSWRAHGNIVFLPVGFSVHRSYLDLSLERSKKWSYCEAYARQISEGINVPLLDLGPSFLSFSNKGNQ